MKSMISHETSRRRLENQECRLHCLPSCSLCQYDGTYSLDIENPAHQAVISNFLAKSRTKNYRELMFERINERRNNRRRFIRRIREQPRDEPVAAKEIVVLSSDDDSNFMMTAPAPTRMNIAQAQITPESGTVPTVSSRKYDHAVRENISKPFPKKRLFGTRLRIPMPAGTPREMTASVNYAASAGDSAATYVSSGAGRVKTGVPVMLNSSSRAANDSQSTSKASVIQSSSVPSSTSHTVTTTPARRTDVNHSLAGIRTTNYSAQWLILPNSSTTSSSSSGMNSISSRITPHQGAPDPMDVSDVGEVLQNTVALKSWPRQTSATVPDGSLNAFGTKSSDGKVTSIVKPLPKTVRPSALDTPHYSREGLLQRASPVSGNASNQHTLHSRPVIDPHSGHTMKIPPPTCYNNSGRFAPGKLCCEECSEGRCYIIKCSSKDCSTYIPNTITDGNCGEKQSLVRFSHAHDSQPLQQKTTLPRQISLDKCLNVPMPTRIARPFSRRESTSSSLIRSSNLQNRAPYRFVMNNSMAPFSSQTHRISGNLVGHSAPSRPVTLTSSIREIEHPYGRPQTKSMEIPVKINAPPENTALLGSNRKKLNVSQRADSRSPDEVVESYLTRKLSSSTAPWRNGVFSSGRLLARRVPSSSNPSQPATNKSVHSRPVQMPFTTGHAGPLVQMDATLSRESTLNRDRNPLKSNDLSLFDGGKLLSANAVQTRWNASRSSCKHHLEAEEPPMKRMHYLVSPTSTTATVVEPVASGRNLSSTILPEINYSNATAHPTLSSAVPTSHSLQFLVNMATSIEPALEKTERSGPPHTVTDLSGPLVPVNSSSSGSMLIQDTSLQQDQPLPPFESINGKFQSRIKEYWDKPTQLADASQSLRNESNIHVQKICDWLLNSTSEPLHPMLQSNAEENSASASPIVPASRSDDVYNKDVQNCKQPTALGPTLMTPTRKLSLANLEPIQGIVSQMSPYSYESLPRSEDFLIVCEGYQGFKVSASILERASPILKDFAKKCCRWHEINGEEYRTFDVLGVSHWAMLEILKFVFHDSYNHNFMRTSHMKRVLDMLEIKYEQSQTFIFPVEPNESDLM